MRFFSVLSFFCAVFFCAGCTTSRVIEDTRTTEIIIDRFGDVTFQGKRVAPDQVAAALASAKVPKAKKIRILVPQQRDHLLMRTVADNLTDAGYRPPMFATDKITSADLKTPAN